jgi:hypothetical protein
MYVNSLSKYIASQVVMLDLVYIVCFLARGKVYPVRVSYPVMITITTVQACLAGNMQRQQQELLGH